MRNAHAYRYQKEDNPSNTISHWESECSKAVRKRETQEFKKRRRKREIQDTETT
jgi:hypothetical protein